MFPNCFHSVMLVVVFLQLKGTACFFVKWFRIYGYGSTSGYCFSDTGQIQSNGSWGNLSFLAFSYNSCLDPAAQFRFRDNGAMLNLKRQGCLAAFNKSGSGYDLDMFYLYVDSVSLDTAACAQKPNESIYRAITQTPEGALSVYYKGQDKSSFQTWCASYTSNSQLYRNYGITRYMGLSTRCHSIYSHQKFIFGSVTCYGDKVKNANCPKDQYMVVKFATYRGLLAPKTCGFRDDYSCDVDVTCLVKKQCDGLHECNITVDDNLFSGDLCAGLSNYLYFEYQCIDTVKPFNELCVHDVSLSYSSLPYEGVVQITTDSGTKNVCWQSLKNSAKETVCRELGHDGVYFLVNISTPTNAKGETFSGSINCNGHERYLSQCSITASANESCSELSYIQCGHWLYYTPYFKRLLQDKPFSASASSEGHSASDARISSGSSWCAPVSDYKHYLQVDLGRLHYIYLILTYGDSTSTKWVATYNLNYTIDLAMVNWNTLRNIQGNKNGYNHGAWVYLNINTRALRFMPLTYVGQPCMRVETWGNTLAPDKPRNLALTNITSRSAEISWQDPKYRRQYVLSRFRIKLKKENSLILNIATGKVNEYEISNLTPYTTYEISVAAGNYYGFGEESNTSFLTSEEVPSGPPLNIRTTSRSASSLSFAWDPPDTTKQNGVIISYTACVSHFENGPCFQTFVTSERKWLVVHLNELTKYYVRVLASTKVGHGNYSESKGFFTSETPSGLPLNIRTTSRSASSLSFAWDPPDKTEQNGVIISYKACVSHLENEPCFQTFTTRERKWLVGNLNSSTKYFVRVLASTKVGHGNYSESKGFFTNGLPAEKATAETSSTLTFSLKIPSKTFVYFYVVALKLKDGKEPASSDSYSELVTYVEAENSTNPKPYIAAVVTSSGVDGNMFVLGDGRNTDDSTSRKRRSTTSDYFNGPLEPGTSYSVFQRIIINEMGDYYSTDWSPPSKTSEGQVPDQDPSDVPDTDDNDDGSKNYLFGMIALAILLVIVGAIIALYFICQNHRRKSSSTKANVEKTNEVSNSQHIYDDVGNYEQVDDEQSTYRGLNKPGEVIDDHSYAHLNEVTQNMRTDQKETGF